MVEGTLNQECDTPTVMEVNNSATERAGSKEKISKWKLYKTQIKRLKESSKQEVPTVAKAGV